MMEKAKEEKGTKALLYWLRYHPGDIAINLDEEGWANLDSLSTNSRRKYQLSIDEIKHIVENDSKNRFLLSENSKKIKAIEAK